MRWGLGCLGIELQAGYLFADGTSSHSGKVYARVVEVRVAGGKLLLISQTHELTKVMSGYGCSVHKSDLRPHSKWFAVIPGSPAINTPLQTVHACQPKKESSGEPNDMGHPWT